MVKHNKFWNRAVSWASVAALLATMGATGIPARASGNASISYSFAQNAAGYAEGTISFTAASGGTYNLYWADSQGALAGYYPIDTLEVSSGQTGTISMGNHTAIPAGADRIIAVEDSGTTPVAVYSLPANRLLSTVSGDKLYSFSAYSDIHIDRGSNWYKDADQHFNEGLRYATDRGSDYMIVSGDCVTNDSGPDKEWKAYEGILSESDFVNPVWESDGNHDLRQDVDSGISSFITHSGTNSVKGYDKSYFYKVEEKTGDVFIFMSLDRSAHPSKDDVFSGDQLTWAENLIAEYADDDVNIFLVQHAPINGYGAGDRMSNPYYGGLLNTSYTNNARFKKLIQDYPDVVWVSGHTHEDFTMDYNYSNEGGEAANMIHIPSLAGSTLPKPSDDDLERNEGHGFNSQGYYTEVYENEIVFYGVNLTDQLIYPKYCYIMEGGRTEDSSVNPQPQEPALTGEIVDISGQVASVKSILSKYYNYASYDQYQALKKLYYQYKDQTTADRVVLTQFQEKINALAEFTGTITVYPLKSTYYFENNKSWSKVYAYAWTGSKHNAEWPGVKISKVGTNNGNDVYGISFNSAGEYSNLIFTDGSSQTVDIALCDYSGNCFKLGSTTDGKYKVSNYDLDGNTPEPPDPPVVEGHNYALLYYVSGEHDWTDTSKLCTSDGDGTYYYTFTSQGTENLSFSLYDKTDKVYHGLTQSVGLDYSDGASSEYTLTEASSRGKSITVNGLTAGAIVRIRYTPADHKIAVMFGEEREELENTSTVSAATINLGERLTVNCAATGGSGTYQYEVLYKQTAQTKWTTAQAYSANTTATVKPAKAVTYNVKVKVSDGQTEAEKNFTLTVVDNTLKNNSTISKTAITLGQTVQVTCNAAGGSGGYQYAVFYKRATDSKWTTKQDFKSNASVTIKPAAALEYDVCVKAKDSAGATAKTYFKVTVVKGFTNLTTISADSITLGSTVKVTCLAAGGTEPYQYAVYYKKTSDKKWTTKQDYSENSVVKIKPGRATTYEICVKCLDGAGKTTKKYFNVTVN